MELYNESSPVAAENFINLAEAGYYDGIVFHRIVPDFVIQGGDPEGTGGGGPGYEIPTTRSWANTSAAPSPWRARQSRRQHHPRLAGIAVLHRPR